MKSDLLGAVIAITAAIASNFGVNVQKKSHTYEELRPKHEQRPYTRRPLWWAGMLLVIFGSLGDFFALGFAAQTLVASLGGGSTIFANVVFAHFWLKQHLYFTDILGVAIVTVGVVVLALASSAEGKYTIDEIYILMRAPQFIIYVMVTTMFTMTLLLRVRRSRAPALRAIPTQAITDEDQGTKQLETSESSGNISAASASSPFPSPIKDNAFMSPVVESPHKTAKDGHIRHQKEMLIIDPNLPLYWAAISGTVGAQSVLLAKCVMEMIFESIDGENQFKYFGTYVLIAGMVVTLLTQTHALNLACMTGDTMSAFPVFQAFWIGMSNISGIVFFQQAHSFTKTQWIMFPSAMGLVMFGIYLISKHEKLGSPIKYSVAMPMSLGNPRQDNIVAQSFQFTELTPQEEERINSSSPGSSIIAIDSSSDVIVVQ